MSRRCVYPFERAPTGREVREGEWRPVLLREERRWTAIIACPRCGAITTLDHARIDDHGLMAQPELCAAIGCGWLASVRLVGWYELRHPGSAA